MKKLTVEQFNALVFTFSIDETVRTFEEHIDHWPSNEDEWEERTIFESWTAGHVTATCDDIKITFSYEAQGGRDTYEAAHEFEVLISENPNFEVEGFTLVDEDGDELEGWELRQAFIEKFNGAEWEQEVKADLPTPEVEDVDDVDDVDDGEEAEATIVKRDNDMDIRFIGDMVAKASSSPDRAMGSSYSGSVGRWTVLRLYKTASGKFICEQIGYTRWQGDHDRFPARYVRRKTRLLTFSALDG